MKKTKILNAASNFIQKNKMRMVGLSTTIMATMPMTVKADWGDGEKDAESLVQQIAEIVIKIFPLVGAFFVISGAFKLFMAYKDGQGEAQNAAVKDIVIGAVFLAFRLFVWKPLSEAMF